MAYLAEATAERLRALARSIARHRSGGGVLDDLPAAERDLLQAMDEEQRDFFLAELARAQAQEGRGRFHLEQPTAVLNRM
jgi:hypothetical protein